MSLCIMLSFYMLLYGRDVVIDSFQRQDSLILCVGWRLETERKGGDINHTANVKTAEL